MRIPRNLSGRKLAKQLEIFGYRITRQTGSHARLTTLKNGKHDITIPLHSNLRVGTLSRILLDVSSHLKLSRKELLEKMDL